MSAIESLDSLIEEMYRVVDDCPDDRGRVRGAFDRMERALEGGERLLLDRFVEGKSSYARHLIHREPDNRFLLMCIVWRPGQGTPIHDHPSWGVIGVLKSKMRFVNYVIDESNGRRRLEVSETLLGPAGTVVTVFPPVCDIHRMENATRDDVAVTLHCYGQELTEFQIYSPETAATRPGGVSYDSRPD